jgi:hypothetical protein
VDDLIGAKAIGKAVETSVKGVGRFLGKLCMPAAEEFGLLLRDKVAAYRLNNLEKIVEKAQAKIDRQNIPVTGNVSPRVLKEVIEESSWASDDTLQGMWAGLIAESASHAESNDDTLTYIAELKGLTAFQARLLNAVYSDPRCCSIKSPIRLNEGSTFLPENPVLFDIPAVLRCYPAPLNEIVPIEKVSHDEILRDSTHHWIALGRFRPQIDGLIARNLFGQVHYFTTHKDQLEFLPSVHGLDFYMRCLGYSLYPLEAFLLTLQHWSSLRGVNPFTYGKG